MPRYVSEREHQYLTRVEWLAKNVIEQAAVEGWLTYLPEDDDETPLRRSINALARALRFTHDADDGCAPSSGSGQQSEKGTGGRLPGS